MKIPAVYIITNKRNGTLYTGVTSNLVKRVWRHKEGVFDGFSKRYGCNILVYYELFQDLESAFHREKQIKSWSRKNKLKLIEKMNPQWNDLFDTITENII